MLTRKDEMILLSILKAGDEASLVNLRRLLIESTTKQWSIGNVFVSLEKLENLGYTQTRLGNPTARRGGKGVKFYSITSVGLAALRETKMLQDAMWSGLNETVLNG